jgi:hypothetical protein
MHGHDTLTVGRTRRGVCRQCKSDQQHRAWVKLHPRKLSNPRFHRLGHCRIPDCDLCFDVLMVTMP